MIEKANNHQKMKIVLFLNNPDLYSFLCAKDRFKCECVYCANGGVKRNNNTLNG